MMRAAARPRPDAPSPEPALRALGTVRHFAPQQTIFAEGEPTAHVMLVLHGMVRSCNLFPDGRRHIGAFWGAGDLFGLERHTVYLSSAEAVCDTAVVLYPAPEGWCDMTRPHDGLPYQMLEALTRDLDHARGHARLLGRLRAIEKMAAFILECRPRAEPGAVINLAMTRQDIGDYLGLTVETVSRCLARLKRDGLIDLRSSRRVDILDAAGLRRVSA